jgi:hypothetical protein
MRHQTCGKRGAATMTVPSPRGPREMPPRNASLLASALPPGQGNHKWNRTGGLALHSLGSPLLQPWIHFVIHSSSQSVATKVFNGSSLKLPGRRHDPPRVVSRYLLLSSFRSLRGAGSDQDGNKIMPSKVFLTGDGRTVPISTASIGWLVQKTAVVSGPTVGLARCLA